MSLANFSEDPWLTSHSAYEESTINVRPAPEFSTAEVMVASTYRAVGFPGYAENAVPKAGRDFDKSSLAARANIPESVDSYTWQTVLHGILESPKQPKQSSKRFLSLCPLVPDVALYSGSARLAGNSWNPGALVARMIQLGAPTQSQASEIWERLFWALTVGDGDDIWARWLQSEFEKRRRQNEGWTLSELGRFSGLPDEERRELQIPAQQFVRDLEAIIQAKESMTRRQWVSLLEGIMRLGAVSHVLWLCKVNDRIWRILSAQLGHGEVDVPNDELKVRLGVFSTEQRMFSYGNAAVPIIKDFASRYLQARLGINVVLWALQDMGIGVKKLDSSRDILSFFESVASNKGELNKRGVVDTLFLLLDEESKTIACKKGIGANLVEFSRHTLGQRQTTNEALRGYDQSYFLKKRGESRNAQWVLSLGPVAVLALVHCCLKEVKGPRSVHRLCEHLGAYGIGVEVSEIEGSDLGRNLRMLGLILDSPDAENGMLLVPPFGGMSSMEEK